ncbi:J domain-containing protein [Knoellia aerolata]|uniref:J domain-containing protein n=1 Tax=Knoellia aerolata TaxID=442954 RepID=UPI0009FC8ED9
MSSDDGDLYSALGLTREATPAQVRRAYRSLMRQNHPDTREPGDPASDAALQRALAAYAILGDPELRAGYDERTTRRDPVTPPPVRRARTFPRTDPQTSPIRVGPVRWHRSG